MVSPSAAQGLTYTHSVRIQGVSDSTVHRLGVVACYLVCGLGCNLCICASKDITNLR